MSAADAEQFGLELIRKADAARALKEFAIPPTNSWFRARRKSKR